MKDKFYIGIAGLTVEMNVRSPLARSFCGEFIIDTPKKADIIADTDRSEILKEMERAEEGASEEYAELLCLYRSIAEQLPFFDRFVFHGAAISYNDEEGYLFTAPSGTGKSTHIRLWRQYIGDPIDIINGDKPIIHITDSGAVVCSTPWAGKENWRRNIKLPLKAMCILTRGAENKIERLDPAASIKAMLHQIYLPKKQAGLGRTLELLDKLLTGVPLYLLACDMSEEAVKTSYTAMTGRRYGE